MFLSSSSLVILLWNCSLFTFKGLSNKIVPLFQINQGRELSVVWKLLIKLLVPHRKGIQAMEIVALTGRNPVLYVKSLSSYMINLIRHEWQEGSSWILWKSFMLDFDILMILSSCFVQCWYWLSFPSWDVQGKVGGEVKIIV